MKGESVVINGDTWTVVDEAPAAPLAEMVAALLEEEGFVVMVRGLDLQSDAFSHLGSTSVTTTFVLVPENQADAAVALIAETVTDFEGPALDELMDKMAAGELVSDFAVEDTLDDDEFDAGPDDERAGPLDRVDGADQPD
jgi:hypothetical protein